MDLFPFFYHPFVYINPKGCVLMKLTFLGGNQNVTGSSSLFEIDGIKIMIDSGLMQGQGGLKEFSKIHNFNTREFEFDISELNYLFLTHSHIDHIGRSPLVYKHNPQVKIVSTEATASLARLNLQDSAYLNKLECERWNKKVKSNLFTPIYTSEDANAVAPNIRCYDYDTEIKLTDRVSAYLRPNGHIIGSCAIEIVYKDEFHKKSFLFTGDTSGLSSRIPFTKPANKIGEIDYIISESTYGNRLHDKIDFKKELLKTLRETKRNVLMPVFAIHKSTVILQFLYELFEEYPELNDYEIYLDSPMSIQSHKVISETSEYWGEKWNDDLFGWEKVNFVKDFSESQTIATKNRAIILSASGMLQGGRILTSHLPKILSQKDSCIIFTGFACEGSLANKLLNCNQKTININGKPVPIKSDIKMIQFSGHADKNSLIEYLKTSNKKKLKKVFLVHGDEESQIELKKELNRHLDGVDIEIPEYKQTIKI